MALRHSRICNLSPEKLASSLVETPRKAKIIDCRSFLEYNDNHIVGAVNICCSKLIKRRLQQEKLSLKDLLHHCRIEIDETTDIVIYDHRSESIDDVSSDSFVYVLLKKLVLAFEKVHLLSGGFVKFHSLFPKLTENKIWKFPGLTALSQPCLQTMSSGPTRILPFLYLGSEEDANNKELLQSHNITYELNVSNKCPKPDFVPDGHFMRIPVNDSHNEKLLPYFIQTAEFVDKARESNESVLVHCLAGISRSPTVAIAYVMRYLQMTYEDAYRYVKAKRATISPNFNFLGQLLEYEKQLIQEKVIQTSPQPPAATACFASTSTSTSESMDFVLGPAQSPPPMTAKPSGKRFNLSLRFSPFADSPTSSSPKDASPTTALARLQFDKPLGKENRTGSGSQNPLGFISLSRPTRLVKEQNVTSIQEEEVGQWEASSKSVTHQSVSISISKGFKSRKSSLEQPTSETSPLSSRFSATHLGLRNQGCDYGKKFKVHKIVIEGEDDAKVESEEETQGLVPARTSTSSMPTDDLSSVSTSSLSPVACYKRDFSRSDSVSTSGIGSEISENELQASGSWEMTDSGNHCDDGVFSDSCSGLPKSPRRQLQLWSSDSGHWSSTDDGASCTSCSSGAVYLPPPAEPESIKSPEKRKCPVSLFPHRLQGPCSHEKRKSYAGDGGSSAVDDWPEGSTRRPKRWSISEDFSQAESISPHSEGLETAHAQECEDSENDKSESPSDSKSGHLTFDNHWFNLLSGSELTCCERGQLYRVHSCPGLLGCGDWLHLQQPVPDSPPDHEPISDSVLLKMRSCCHRSRHERSFEHTTAALTQHQHPWNKNRFSFGHVDYDELLSKLHRVQDSKPESSHSSSSTLASSSFSIVVQ